MEVSKLPQFTGHDAEARLSAAQRWVSEHCPGRQLTLEELGQIMGVTRERVRQIEAKALKKLRHPVYLRQLER